MKRKIVSFICLCLMFTLMPMQPANAKARPKLTANSKTNYTGQSYTLKLKNTTKKTAVKWKTSNTSAVTIAKKTGNIAVLKGKKKGKATITATYKGNTYRCKITVKQ